MDSLAKVTVSTPYEADSRQVMEILDQAVKVYAKQVKEVIVEEPKVQGITELADSSVNITVICRTLPLRHWEVERGLRLAVKEALDEAGIGIPYPQQDVHFKNGSGRFITTKLTLRSGSGKIRAMSSIFRGRGRIKWQNQFKLIRLKNTSICRKRRYPRMAGAAFMCRAKATRKAPGMSTI